MNTEELRSMVDGMKIVLGPNAQAACINVKAKSKEVCDLIVDTLREEFNNACCAKDCHDFNIKVCDYVNKLYSALMDMSHDRWISYIAFVELGAEFSAKTFIAEKQEYVEADKVHRISYMTMINNNFRDFVFTFFILTYPSNLTLTKILTEYHEVYIDI